MYDHSSLTKRQKNNPKYQKHNYEIHVREHGLDESIDFLKNDLVSDAHMYYKQPFLWHEYGQKSFNAACDILRRELGSFR